jgi:hypothetical protein
MQQLLMPRQFTHQPMLHWDPPSTSRQEVSASGEATNAASELSSLSP